MLAIGAVLWWRIAAASTPSGAEARSFSRPGNSAFSVGAACGQSRSMTMLATLRGSS